MATIDSIKMPGESESHELRDNNIYTLIAPAYNPSETYLVGNYCIYDYKLYKCINVTTGTWDDTSWEETTIFTNT